MATKNRYSVLKPFEMPNGKAQIGSIVELSREQAKYLLLGGKIVEAEAKGKGETK
jgi:hypothetical protein